MMGRALVAACAIAVISPAQASAWTAEFADDHARGYRACVARAALLEVVVVRAFDGSWDNAYLAPSIELGNAVDPGSTVHILVGGRRFSGEESIQMNRLLHDTMVSKVTALVSFTLWPKRNFVDAEVDLAGYGAAIKACVEHVGGRPPWYYGLSGPLKEKLDKLPFLAR